MGLQLFNPRVNICTVQVEQFLKRPDRNGENIKDYVLQTGHAETVGKAL
ncbi:hypothetical protein [uncultured Muribaculum sp.]|nr:hypothetical protein [uncultured Muribaculum sp.]